MGEDTIFKLDKKYTPFLFKAIEAAKKSEFVTKYKYDIDSFNNYISINNGFSCYTISFYSKEITQDNWMNIGAGGIVIDDINVDIDIDSGEVISIYTSR